MESDIKPVRYLTVMADYGNGPYAWLTDHSRGHGIGFGIADVSYGLAQSFDVPSWLDTAFAAWVLCFERFADDPRFDWMTFNQEGHWLAQMLRHYLPLEIRVYYEKPCEDTNYKINERTECFGIEQPNSANNWMTGTRPFEQLRDSVY